MKQFSKRAFLVVAAGALAGCVSAKQDRSQASVCRTALSCRVTKITVAPKVVRYGVTPEDRP